MCGSLESNAKEKDGHAPVLFLVSTGGVPRPA